MPKWEAEFGSVLDFLKGNVHFSSFLPLEVKSKPHQLLWNKFSSALSGQSVLFSIVTSGRRYLSIYCTRFKNKYLALSFNMTCAVY